MVIKVISLFSTTTSLFFRLFYFSFSYVKTGSPSASQFGSIPSPGAVGTAMRPSEITSPPMVLPEITGGEKLYQYIDLKCRAELTSVHGVVVVQIRGCEVELVRDGARKVDDGGVVEVG